MVTKCLRRSISFEARSDLLEYRVRGSELYNGTVFVSVRPASVPDAHVSERYLEGQRIR